MATFGLLGEHLGHSFSRNFFTLFFTEQALPHTYENVTCTTLELNEIIHSNKFKGLNVTIPHKQNVIQHLDELSPEAKAINAVNTIVFAENKTIGYNTDCIGFENTLPQGITGKALVIGNGGASQAIQYVLETRNIAFDVLTRTPSASNHVSYFDIGNNGLTQYELIVNCTPLGTAPNIDELPDIPYYSLTKQHILYDLIYNPEETAFLKEGRKAGAKTINGLEMLHEQALAAWTLWNQTI